MGRKLKYGEKTKWASVRVPESKAQMIRPLIREFVEILFLPSIKTKRKLLEAFVEKVLTLFVKNHESEIKNRQFKSFKEFIKEY